MFSNRPKSQNDATDITFHSLPEVSDISLESIFSDLSNPTGSKNYSSDPSSASSQAAANTYSTTSSLAPSLMNDDATDEATLLQLMNSSVEIMKNSNQSLHRIEDELKNIPTGNIATLEEILKNIRALTQHATYSATKENPIEYQKLYKKYKKENPEIAEQFAKEKLAIQNKMNSEDTNKTSAAIYRLHRREHSVMVKGLLKSCGDQLQQAVDQLKEVPPSKIQRTSTYDSVKSAGNFSLFAAATLIEPDTGDKNNTESVKNRKRK